MRYILIPLTLPMFVVGWGYVALMTLTGAAHRWRFDKEQWVLEAQWRPWVTRFWRYSTTLSYGIIFQPAASERTRAHERVHVRQAQDRTLLALVLGLVAVGFDWGLGLALWCAGPLYQLPNFLTAVLRGGHVYRDAEHERSAYAQTDRWRIPAGSTSWLERHLSRPRGW